MEAARKRNTGVHLDLTILHRVQRSVHAARSSANERIVLVRNPRYYDAPFVALEELAFLPVVDGTAVMNLYKAGVASSDSWAWACPHCLLRFSAARKIIIRRRDSAPSFRASAHAESL